ncbi:MAG: hypothetical protein IJ268_05250, partial [Proteobacteria bacterium]|nr:hypothetical protein [Pseudomonadota bacterium]
SRQQSLLALCAVASLGVGMISCGDEVSGVRGKLNDSCSDAKPCGAGLVCGDDGKCVEETQEPVQTDPAKAGEACSEEIKCAEGLECGVEGKCVEKNVDPGPGPKEDPCEGVNCPDGKQCLNARCYDPECIVDGEEKTCEGGQMCSKGDCVDDGCQDKTCDEGEVCRQGVCEDALCLEKAIVCTDGATCVKGSCVDNECLGQTCEGGLVCSKGDCVYPACVGKEKCDPGKVCNESGACEFEHDPALNAVADTAETDENGASATISLTLNNPPSKDVTVTCELSPESAAAEAEVSCEGVLFDAQNYGDVQTIHVIGLPDNVIDEDQKYTLTITTVSEDAAFNGLSQSIEMVNKNVDTVGVGISVNGDKLTTTESGGSASFSAVLKAKPAADVTFVVSSSNPGYGQIDGAEENKLTVTFTPENWDTPQEIKVIGIDDDGSPNDVEHVYQIVFENTVSEDSNYSGLEIKPIDAVNLDDDIAEVFLDKESVVTEEGGLPVDIKVRLGLAPADQVDVGVSLFAADKETPTEEVKLLTEAKLTLNKDNYKDGVVISLQGVDDHIIDGDKDYKVRLKFSTLDERYENLAEKWIDGRNLDKNVAGLNKEYTETTVTEAGSTLDIALSLTSIPTAPVTVAIASSDKSEMTVKPDTMTFSPENWNVAQTITVTGMDDVIIDGDIVSNLTLDLTSDDKNFGGDPENEELNAISDSVTINLPADVKRDLNCSDKSNVYLRDLSDDTLSALGVPVETDVLYLNG